MALRYLIWADIPPLRESLFLISMLNDGMDSGINLLLDRIPDLEVYTHHLIRFQMCVSLWYLYRSIN